MILSSVILLDNLPTSHRTIYLFIKNNNNIHFTYQLLWVSHTNIVVHKKNYNYEHFTYQLILVEIAYAEIRRERVKNYVTSTSNLHINNFYHLTCNSGQLLSMYKPPSCLYLINTYCQQICVLDDTVMCNFDT